jgi:uncharacterized protein YcbK (DUF882 family)
MANRLMSFEAIAPNRTRPHVQSCAAPIARSGLSLSGAMRGASFAVCLLVSSSMGLPDAGASGDTRTLSLHHVHTNENLTITYKKDGQYDEDALKKINWIMRDWRKNQAVKMDPQEIDLLWEVYQEVGAKQPIYIICGYRSPATNEMLRSRSRRSGVARSSQHTLGKAIDFYIPGVPLDKLRATAMKLQGGGVGYYPTSGSPFVHLDIGNVRAWPRMTRQQLVKLFPDGRTAHIPADGTPLPGYQLALADLQRAHRSGASPAKRSLLAQLFGRNKDAEESDDNSSSKQDAVPARDAAAKPAAKPARTVVASIATPATEKTQTVVPVPLPPARPMYQIASADSEPAPAFKPRRLINLASLSPNEIINLRGLWEGLVAAVSPPAPMDAVVDSDTSISSARRVLASSMMAAAGRESTGTVGPFAGPDRVPNEIALAYAGSGDTPMGRQAERAAVITTRGGASIARKPADTIINTRTEDRTNDPWLRGVMLTTSVQHSLVVTRVGDPDYTGLVQYMHKPGSAVLMTFSNDPHLGMTTEAFTGSAVVFQATVTFDQGTRRTAALR